jgi:hypothetical protein
VIEPAQSWGAGRDHATRSARTLVVHGLPA